LELSTRNSQLGTWHLAALVYIFYKPLTRRSPGNRKNKYKNRPGKRETD